MNYLKYRWVTTILINLPIIVYEVNYRRKETELRGRGTRDLV